MKMLADILMPLVLASRSKADLKVLIEDLGWSLEFNDDQHAAFQAALNITQDTQRVIDASIALGRDRLHGDEVEELITAAQAILEQIETLRAGGIANVAQLPEPLNDPGEWPDLLLRLPEVLLTRWLAVHHAVLYHALVLTGVIEEAEREQPLPPERTIHWDRIAGFLSDPPGTLAEVYGWGDELQVSIFLMRFARLADAIGFFPDVHPIRTELADAWLGGTAGDEQELEIPLFDMSTPDGEAELSAEIVLGPAKSGPSGPISGFAVTNITEGETSVPVELEDGWSIELGASGDLNRAIEAQVFPDGVSFLSTGPTVEAEIQVSGAPEQPWILAGTEDGPHLSLSRFRAYLGAETGTDGDLWVGFSTVEGTEQALRLVIAPAEGDGFVSDLLGESDIAITADIGARWSRNDGFQFEGGVGFEVIIPLDARLGPILIDRLRLALAGGVDGLTIEAAVSAGLDVSVLAIVVEDVGLRVELVPVAEENRPGALGPLDLAIGFKPPMGMGMVIEGGDVLSGGAYLYHDEALAEYAGVGQLGFLSIKLSAIGVLTTQMPDGTEGWSLFLSVFSEFPPIQLGFGVTLNGVGGLVGLHRSFDDEALRTRLLDGALDSIMFPEDPVANAPSILEDIRAVFPPSQGQFVFGAMMKLGWGTPTLLEVDLGVIVELPDPIKIALLGQIHAALPRPDTTIIELNMDVFGVANLTEGTVSLDATIRDSHIMEILTLSGDMAFRAVFTDQPSMLLSIGGFHPKFAPPPNVPDLKRMKASLPVGNMAAVELSAYVAITSNTFQAGGRLDIWVKAVGFTAEGYFAFDALIQFSPFGFDFYVGFGVSVAAGKITLMGVDVSANIIGPGPWEIDGYATFEILKIEKKLNIDLEVGKKKSVSVPSYNVAELLAEALELPEAWTVAEGDTESAIVPRDPGPDEAARLHPGGRVRVSQRIVPLGQTIEKFGNGAVSGPDTFTVDGAWTGNDDGGTGEAIGEWFAPAEFFKYSDADKLKAPSFELYDSGVLIGSDEMAFGSASRMDKRYEEIVVDPELNQRRIGRGKPTARVAATGSRPAPEGDVLTLNRETAGKDRTRLAEPSTTTRSRPSASTEPTPTTRNGKTAPTEASQPTAPRRPGSRGGRRTKNKRPRSR